MSAGMLTAPEPAATAPKTATATADSSPAAPKKRPVEDLLHLFHPSRLTWENADWIVVGWMTAVHVGALAAPFFFSWTAVFAALAMHWLTISIGIGLCYHRLLSHKSFEVVAPVKFLVYLCGVLSGQGSPLVWSVNHRVHHARSDKEGDPHSPLHGAWWSHLNWMMVLRTKDQEMELAKRYCPDLLRDPMLMFFHRTYGLFVFGSAIVAYLVGGWPILLWAICLRLVVAYHGTWFVNSATHLWGYVTYKVSDESRNLWWVALLTYGEGWHNNHHAYPRLARAGHKWWEIDTTFWVIRTLQLLGLARSVNDSIPDTAARRQVA